MGSTDDQHAAGITKYVCAGTQLGAHTARFAPVVMV